MLHFFNIIFEVIWHFFSDWLYGLLSSKSAITLALLACGVLVGWHWLIRVSDHRFGFTRDRLPADWIPLKSTPRITARVNDWEFEKKIRVIQCNHGIAIALARGSRHRFLIIPEERLEVTQGNGSCRIGDKLSQVVLVARRDIACLDLEEQDVSVDEE